MSDLVVISLEAWDQVWRRNQHLVAGLLRHDPHLRVLFVEPAQDPLHGLRREHSAVLGRGLRRAAPEPGSWSDRLWLWEPTKWLPRRVRSDLDAHQARQVVTHAQALGLANPTLWVNAPSGAEVLRITGWPCLYDITDDWTLADRSSEEHARALDWERFLLDRADEVVVCSPALVQSKGRDRAVRLVPNAVDAAAYETSHPRPSDLPVATVALYLGTIHRDRIDVDLCAAVAAALDPESQALVMVGPNLLDEADRTRLESAGALLLGSRPSPQVPAYLQHADVLVVPHVVTLFTLSLDPIKAYEYRAAGRPVISTPVPGFEAAPGVVVAAGALFVDAVTALLRGQRQTDSPDASVPTWADRVEQMARVLATLDGRRS